MSEACGRVTDSWFNSLGFEKLRVPKAAANIASRRISERQGMRIVETKESDYVSGRLLTEVWEIRPKSGGRAAGHPIEHYRSRPGRRLESRWTLRRLVGKQV